MAQYNNEKHHELSQQIIGHEFIESLLCCDTINTIIFFWICSSTCCVLALSENLFIKFCLNTQHNCWTYRTAGGCNNG